MRAAMGSVANFSTSLSWQWTMQPLPTGRSSSGALSMPDAEPETTMGIDAPDAGRAGSLAATMWSPRQNFRSSGSTPFSAGWPGRRGKVMVDFCLVRPMRKRPSG